MIPIRPATSADCAEIAEIYQGYTRATVVNWDYEGPTAAQWREKLAAVHQAGLPFLVADDGAVAGFAYLAPFRRRAGWSWTVEDTIYLRPGVPGRGHGSTLLGALLRAADPDRVHQIIAVVAAEGSDAILALHRSHGFVEVGRMPDTGYKFGRWLDCIFLQRPLIFDDDRR